MLAIKIDNSDIENKVKEYAAQHKKAVEDHGCLATIAMMEVDDTSQFGVIVTKSMLDSSQTNSNSKNQIVKFQEKPNPEDALSNWANTGVYFFEPAIYNFIPSKEEAPKYDVAGDLFPKLLELGEFIQAVPVKQDTYWADLGTPQQYLQSVRDIHENKVKLKSMAKLNENIKLGKGSLIKGFCDIAADAQIGENLVLENCVVYPKSIIKTGAKLKNCILGESSYIAENTELANEIVIKSKVKS